MNSVRRAPDPDEPGGGRRPRIGRPPRISRDAVVAAVLEIGFEDASVQAVARRLGVDPSTLYGHVRNRADMLDAAAEAAIAGMSLPDAELGWRDYLRGCAEQMWDLFTAHPGLALHLRRMRSLPPSLVRYSMEIAGLLIERHGCDVHLAALIIDTVGDLVTDSYLTVHALDEPMTDIEGRPSVREHATHLIDDLVAADVADADYAGVIREAMGTPESPSTWWREKLELVLDGVEQRLTR